MKTITLTGIEKLYLNWYRKTIIIIGIAKPLPYNWYRKTIIVIGI